MTNLAYFSAQTISDISFDELLASYAEAATRGGSGANFLSTVFLSLMTGSKISLSEFDRLDPANRLLFWQILNVFNRYDWNTEGLNWLMKIIQD